MFSKLFLGIKFSFSYFSIFPIKFQATDNLSDKEVLNNMLLSLPLVGWFIGLVTLLVYAIFAHTGWYGALISALFSMILYGFLHTEAIIDVFDALYASHSGKDAYEIIKEPTVGAVGVLYGVSFLLIKVASIVFLFTHNLFAEFLSILIISRLSLLTLFILHDFKSSFLTELKNALNKKGLILIFIIAIIIGSWITPLFTVLLLLGVLIGFIISLILAFKLNFVNGDVLGTTLEGVEIVLFMFVALLV